MINEYIEALSENKTEREWVNYAERKAIAAGFKSFEANRKYKPGDKVYFINRRKNFAAFIEPSANTVLDVTVCLSSILSSSPK